MEIGPVVWSMLGVVVGAVLFASARGSPAGGSGGGGDKPKAAAKGPARAKPSKTKSRDRKSKAKDVKKPKAEPKAEPAKAEPAPAPPSPKKKKGKAAKAAEVAPPAPAPAPEAAEAPKKKGKKAKKAPEPEVVAAAAPAEGGKKKKKSKAKKEGKPDDAQIARDLERQTHELAARAPADDGWTVVEAREPAKAQRQAAKRVSRGEPESDGSVTLDCGRFAAAIIGKGGETIKKLAAETGAILNVDKADGGASTVKICPKDDDAASKAGVLAAKEQVEALLKAAGHVAGVETVSATVDAGDKIPAVIGSGGSVIKFITAKSGAHVEAGRNGKTVVTMQGTADQVATARALVAAAIAGVDVAAEATATVELGARGVPLLIGKAGATIRSLQQTTLARIDVGKGSTAATVSGGADAVAAAVAAIRRLIAENSHAEVLALDCHVGVILGKGGATIKKVQEASNARVDVEGHGETGVTVSLAGSTEQIAIAKAAILAAVEAAANGPPLAEGEVKRDVELPEACVGSVIGRGGANVKKIQEDTKAKLDIKEGYCTVYGMPDAVALAADAIEAIVKKQADFDAARAARNAPPPNWDDVQHDPVWGGGASPTGDAETADAWGVPTGGEAWGA